MSRRPGGPGDARARRAQRKRDSLGAAGPRNPTTSPPDVGTPVRPTPNRTIAPASGGASAGSPVAPALSDLVDREALVVTHVVPGPAVAPAAGAFLRVTGQLRDEGADAAGRDRFEHWDHVDGLLPDAGPFSVTSTIHDVAYGTWDVRAALVPDGTDVEDAVLVERAAWSWRTWTLRPIDPLPIATRWAPLAPLARMPAVQPGSWAAFGSLAILLAVAVQLAVANDVGIDPGRALLVTLIASLAGVLAARLWYAWIHPGSRLLPGGWAVDGYLVTAPLTAVVSAAALSLPIGAYLDSATPALFVAVAVARVGCFFAGCCAGRISDSRFAVWSSDHRIGARRVPTQLVESFTGAALTVVAMIGVRLVGGSGMVFVVLLGTYLAIRQGLLRWRAESRRYSWRRAATVAGSAQSAMSQQGLITDQGQRG